MAILNLCIVQPGDTLATIAEQALGSADRWQELAQLNQLPHPHLLMPGMMLQIPDDKSRPLQVGDIVEKLTGDFYYKGEIVAAFTTLRGRRRFIVENPQGQLYIFNDKQLTRIA